MCLKNVIEFVSSKDMTEIKKNNFGIIVKDCTCFGFPSLYILNSIKNENLNNFQINCNGVILEKENNKIICTSSPIFNNLLGYGFESNNIDDIYINEDGLIIRFFNYQSKWITATENSLNDKSKEFFNILKNYRDYVFNPDYVYTFNLIDALNRIIVNYSKSRLILLNVNNKINNDIIDFSDTPFDHVINVSKKDANLQYKHSFLNSRGFIVRLNSYMYKVDHPIYTITQIARGKEADIKYRYLSLILKKDTNNLRTLDLAYLEHKMLFKMIHYSIFRLIDLIYIDFVKMYVTKTIPISGIYINILQRINEEYVTDLYNLNYIDCNKIIMKIVYTSDVKIISNLLGWN